MNRQIRRLGLAGLALFLALFVQLNNLQVLSANRLNDNPLNTRQAVQDFSQPRGVIQTADGVAVIRWLSPAGAQVNGPMNPVRPAALERR